MKVNGPSPQTIAGFLPPEWRQSHFPLQHKNCLPTAYFVLSDRFIEMDEPDIGNTSKFLDILRPACKVEHLCRSTLQDEYATRFGGEGWTASVDDTAFTKSVEEVPSILMLEHLSGKGQLELDADGHGTLHAIACVGCFKVDPRDGLVNEVPVLMYRQSRRPPPRLFGALVFPNMNFADCQDRIRRNLSPS